jgi:glyoxylase I family protein
MPDGAKASPAIPGSLPAPPPLRICGVHHVAIIASDCARSRRFYTEVLGLQVVREVFRAERQSHKLDLQWPDGSQIELFSFPIPPVRLSYPEACGLRHLAVQVADVHASVRGLQLHGVLAQPVQTDPWTGAPFTFIADPDGLPIELVGSEPGPRCAPRET